MKFNGILLGIFFGVALNICSFAQTTAGATLSATIVQPSNILKVRDMNFGNISSGPTGGIVVLLPTESGTRTAEGGVTIPSGSGTVSSAKFIVSGADGYSYSIILPAAPITLSNGTNFMTIDNFTSTPSGSGTFNSGAQTIRVGATLNVDANQEAGLYISTESFEVTINYN
jgi:hypothetical protein